MKSFTFILALLCSNFLAKGQGVRTYNNYGFGSAFSSKINSFNLSYGEMLEMKGKLPIRITTAFEVKLQNLKPGNVISAADLQDFTNAKRLNYTTFNIPVGIEFFRKNIGLGISQEIVSFGFKRQWDKTRINSKEVNIIQPDRFSIPLSTRRNLSTKIYGVYTISDSFSIKAGISTENTIFNLYKDTDYLTQTMVKSVPFFISLRTNIEK